ncbi:hypothetical protein P4159_15865 [Bacillus thuringiensis]|nr:MULTISPECIES: hypothetical protein [Bacillus]MBJ8020599.1 hypothetical protein [Bacillus cereus]MBJ8033195.1 hypothetical protein [Bacillus cereus]MCU5605706.1 hypothetical protein [Bacillus cereus]MEC3597860.1 hypothetical protein [Bacillus thuringiensis]MED1836264.1 hypothetical protein [Bacillus thuringiensis]
MARKKQVKEQKNLYVPEKGHDKNYVPFIGFMLLLLGIRLRFMAKNS